MKKNMRFINALLAMLVLSPVLSMAARDHRESHYQLFWCQRAGGEVEHVIFDGTRVDCLTATTAYEFDFADKWGEAIGQALWYGTATTRRPGIVLILERPGDHRHVDRVRATIEAQGLDIELRTITSNDGVILMND